jgi:hypothetical protein
MKELELVLHREVREVLLKWKKQNYPRFLGRSKVARKASSDFEKARKYPFPLSLSPKGPMRRLAVKSRRRNRRTSSWPQRHTSSSTASTRLASTPPPRRRETSPSSRSALLKSSSSLKAELDKTKPLLAKARQAYDERVRARAQLTDSYRRDMASVFNGFVLMCDAGAHCQMPGNGEEAH